MPYALASDMFLRHGEDYVVQAAEGEGGVTAVDRIDAVLQGASSKMDSYLAPRYSLPLSQAVVDGSDLKDVCCDVALHRLLGRYTTDEAEKRYTQAVQWLRDVSAGRASLGEQDTATATPGGRVVTGSGNSNHDWDGF